MTKRKQRLEPKTKLGLSTKKIIVYTAITGSLLTAIIYFISFFLSNVATPKNAYGIAGTPIVGYTWEANLTINSAMVSGNTNFNDFPVLVKLIHSDLKTVANGGYVENAFGYDIVFSDLNNGQLDHQLEYYDPVIGELVAWVKVPIVQTNVDTDFKIFCGNTSVTMDLSVPTVWGAPYKAVWHMNNDPSVTAPQLLDATNNIHHGTSYGNMNSNDLIYGKIGPAVEFDGNNDYFKMKDYKGVTGTTQRTVTMWYKASTSNMSQRFLSWGKNSTGKKYEIRINGANNALRTENANGQKYGSTNISDGNWHFLTVVLPPLASPTVQDHLLYVDGVLETNTFGGNQALNTSNSGNDLLLGKSNWSSGNTKGVVDEVRILEVARSQDWIITEFNNQNDPENFIQMSGFSVLPIELTNFSAELIDAEVALDWTTAAEINNDYFSIERSGDGFNYEEISQVLGAGNSNSPISYSFVDETPLSGLNYYRLKQTDFDGNFECFAPKVIDNKLEYVVQESKARPNPFASHFTLEFESNEDSYIEIHISDLTGKILHSEELAALSGRNSYTYYGGDKLIHGTYIVSVLEEGQLIASAKVIKN